MRIKRHSEAEVEIPLIPMIDCMFVLLLFFLVATTLKQNEKELPIDLPQSGAAVDAEVKPDTINLAIDSKGQKYYAGEPVTTDSMMQRLQVAAAANPAQKVRISGDVATPYVAIVEIVEMCSFYNLRNVSFHTKSPGK